MPEPTFGEVFHTKDGKKTIFVDPKTGNVTVFDGVLTIEKIQEPEQQLILSNNNEAAQMALKAMSQMSPFLSGLGLIIAPAELSFFVGDKTDPGASQDVLGASQYYVLVPQSSVPLSIGSARVYAWVSEMEKGHKPKYDGYTKHRIMPEQWEWLKAHKDCPIVAWYDADCPVYAAVACQEHAKVLKPTTKPAGTFHIEEEPITMQVEGVAAEEREI